MHKYFDFHVSTATSSVLPTFVNLTYVESRLATRFEMQVLQWVVVLLNCLLIIFPYILDLLDLGITGTLSSSPAFMRAEKSPMMISLLCWT
jgi:hypothetical protein